MLWSYIVVTISLPFRFAEAINYIPERVDFMECEINLNFKKVHNNGLEMLTLW